MFPLYMQHLRPPLGDDQRLYWDYAAEHADKVLGYSPIAYWQLKEKSGTTAVCSIDANQNGTLARDIATMGTVTGIGDGNTAPVFDGTQDFVNTYSTALRDAFNGKEGALSVWAKMLNAAVWEDSAVRDTFRFYVDANNDIRMQRSTSNNQLFFLYKAANTPLSQYTSGLSMTAWFHLGMSWSYTNDRVIYYIDGSQTGATDTGLGEWLATLDANNTNLGKGTGYWKGPLAHPAVFDVELAGADFLDLATV